MSVYFVMDGHCKVKIGWSIDVPSRLNSLQVSHSSELKLIRVIDGGRATEAWLHKKFRGHRLRGEWFRFHEDMLTIVPPDEVPVRPAVTLRRDVRLTPRERLRSIDDLFEGYSESDKLFLLFSQSDEAQRAELLKIIRLHLSQNVQGEAA